MAIQMKDAKKNVETCIGVMPSTNSSGPKRFGLAVNDMNKSYSLVYAVLIVPYPLPFGHCQIEPGRSEVL